MLNIFEEVAMNHPDQFKLNELPAKRAYIRIPVMLFKKRKLNTGERQSAKSHGRFTLSAVAVGGEVYSFTREDVNGEKPTCTRTYSAFSRDLGISAASVNRAIGRLLQSGQIERRGQSEYITTLDISGTFLRLENWVNSAEFLICGKQRRLTLAERMVFALIFTRCDNGKKGGNKYAASNRDIARMLGISEKTVSKAVNVLIGVGLIVRADYERGVNRAHKSIYHLNKQLLSRNNGSTPKTADKPESSDRARWYAQRKQVAEAKAERNEQKARTDNRFKSVDDELRTLVRKEAFAELQGDIAALDIIRARRRELESERIRALRRLHLTPEDLKPQYYCPICNDSGFTEQGKLCGCYAAAHNRKVTE